MACWTDVRAIRVRSSANAYHIIHYTRNLLLVQFMSDESPSQLIFHIVDNNKFFMYKYNFTYHDWFGPLYVILKKIECHVINSASTDDICIITAIRELFVERDVINLMYIHNTQRKL